MNTRAMKGRALAALITALGLLVIVIVLLRAGKVPAILILLVIAFGVYGLRTLWQIKQQGRI